MTARSLPDYSVRNARRVVKQNAKLAIVTCILEALGIPLIMGAVMLHQIVETLPDTRSAIIGISAYVPYMMIGSTCLSVSVVLGLFHAIVSFQETWSRTRVDMLYALPLNGTQRFFSHYAGGALMYLVPYAGAAVLGLLLSILLNFLVHAEELGMTQTEHLQTVLTYYGKSVVGLFLLMWMYYTLSVLLTSCCGTLFESIYTNLLLNLLIPGALAAVIGVVTYAVDGLSFEYSWDIIGFTSPVGGLIYLIVVLIAGDSGDLFDDYSYYGRVYVTQAAPHSTAFLYLRWAVIIVLVTAAMAVLAWQLYRRRKAERVGQPFVWVGAYYLLLTLVTVCILCLMTVGMGLAAILFAAIVFFILEVIRKRGFRRFWLSACVFVGIVTVSIGGYFLTVRTGCFGCDRYIPPAAAVSSAKIVFHEHFDGEGSRLSLEFTDKDVIRAVQDAQRSFRSDNDEIGTLRDALRDGNYFTVDYRDAYDYSYEDDYGYVENSPSEYDAMLDDDWFTRYQEDHYDVGFYSFRTSRVEIVYYSLTGAQCHRSYDLLADDYTALVRAVAGTPLYAEAEAKALESHLDSAYAMYDDDYEERRVPYSVEFEVDNGRKYRSVSLKNAPEKFDQLIQAYQRDLEAMSAEQILNGETVCTIEEMPVTKDCTNTLQMLTSFGFEEFTPLERFFGTDAGGYYYEQILGVRLYAPGTYRFDTRTLSTTETDNVYFNGKPAYEDLFSSDALSIEDDETVADMRALLEAARRPYSTEDDCYLLLVNGAYYLIPMEDAGLAEAVAGGKLVSVAYDEFWSRYDFSDDYEDSDWYDDWYGYYDDEMYGAFGPDEDYDDDYGYYDDDYEYFSDEDFVYEES
ncbi:MAG: hypothetical protein IJ055_00310 [Oscillospiraceae bacterium]|nr:hypothetical protein [Oscillospiraceae bacterium]